MSKNLDFAYDEYLKSREEEAVQAIAGFNKQLERESLRYARFAIPSYYKPHLVSPEQEHLLKRAAAALTSALNIAIHLFFEERHFTHLVRMPQPIRDLIKIDPGYSQSIVFARYDALLEGMSLKVLEFNSDTEAGAGYADQLEEMLLTDPLLEDFFKENLIKTTDRVQSILDTLLAVYEEFGGLETPKIALVDWKNVRTIRELEYLKQRFESKGYKTTIADPRELKFKGGKLYHKDFRVDILYRRVALDELIERADEVQEMIRAYEKRAVCMVNPLRARLASTKALLSILTNPEYDHFFTENENQIKRECLPWTRRTEDAKAFYGGKTVYLLDFLKDEKETVVLKPSVTYGGKGVMIGRETRDQDWNEAIDKAIKGDWVVQEFVNVPILTVPRVVNRKLDFDYKKYNFNMLVFGGKYVGGFARLSQETVVNVARNGGFVPSIAGEIEPERVDV